MCHKDLCFFFFFFFFVTDERLLARELCLSHYGILFPIYKLLYYCWAYDFCFLAYSSLSAKQCCRDIYRNMQKSMISRYIAITAIS